jgi:hypothetical protein
MKVYLLDAMSCFAGEAEIDPMKALPPCTLTPPPEAATPQVAQWADGKWTILAERPPVPTPPVDPLAYQAQRAAEYPPITDYIDGIVKGDQAQVQAYIDACLAVKAKYPKP